jgi:GNAT superfamily N-acetyltransferase
MAHEDVPAGLALCRASGWNQVERDWQRFLAAAPQGAAVAVREGRVIGTVATLPYSDCFTWIAMVLVDPAERGRGVGTALLERGLALVTPGMTPRLDATPAGEAVYRPLGFVGEIGLARWRLADRRQALASVRGVRPFEPRDLGAVLALDGPAFGAGREDQLAWLAAGAPEYAWVAEQDGVLGGFLFGRHGHRCDQLGPLVARGEDAARALVSTCLAAVPGRPFYLDAPDAQVAWRSWLTGVGFAIERPFLRMRRGALPTSEQVDLVFASGGPEFG